MTEGTAVEGTVANSQPKTVEERLAAARERKAARDLEHDRTKAARELAILELEEQLVDGGAGQRGETFEIVDGAELGPVALKLGEFILYRNFQRSMAGSKEPEQEDLLRYVMPCVLHPKDAATIRDLFNRKPVLLLRCASALTTLYGAKTDEVRGKF